MLTRPFAAFDIETIPDPDHGRSAMGLTGDNEAVIQAMTAARLEATDNRTQYPIPPHHRIVTIAIAWLDPGTGVFKLNTLGDDAWDERSHLEAFARLFDDERTAPRLVSWNGNGFDLPIIRYRAMRHGIPMPGLYRTTGSWIYSNYQNRYHDMHIDVMDTLCSHGASTRVGLAAMCTHLGIPDMQFLDGEVYEHILRGDEALVEEYCKLDVVSTLLVFLNWLVHRGDVDQAQLSEYVATIRETLRAEPFDRWREVADGLEAWPCAVA